MTLKAKVLRVEQVALGLVRKWWRPVTCVGIAGGAIVNLIIIPIATWQVPSMAEAAAYVAAATAAFGVRAFEKWADIA